MSEPAQLPPDLADAAAAELLAAEGVSREVVIARLLVEHPEQAAGLQRLATELSGLEALLESRLRAPSNDSLEWIRDYRVIAKIGEGAFGVVYRCKQERPVLRDVAIKVLRAGAGDQHTLRRFAAERQVLATLSHPTITPIFDAGELSDGRPFFVMEYVVGSTIRDYCEAHALGSRELLQLFVQLCHGVAHAHSRGIVHRDLKPANVLIVEGAGGPLPKIIDFGIAKALTSSDSTAEPRTDTGRVLGTPGYMSPEQATGRVDQIDGRADVFALGVMLYELLTGVLPWPRGTTATDFEPVRPSRRVVGGSRIAPTALRGDLDWIALKALAPAREDRYARVDGLSTDIERHLRGDTVSVGPPSLAYRTRKFVARHGLGVTVVVSSILVTMGLTAAWLYGSRKHRETLNARSVAAATAGDAG
jgi:serine/threonine protein kinase